MHVAIVENTRVTHHGQVGVALHEAGARIDLFKPWADGRLPRLGDHDALVVFGGEQAATDDHLHPYLPHLAALMHKFVETGRPVLGICLGSQILARGFGAQNVLGKAREFGWSMITTTENACNDPVFAAVPKTFKSFQWHSDTFTLPEDAVHLATSSVAEVQAFRVGKAGYGMQFHFEASRPVVSDWNKTFPDVIRTMDPSWQENYAAAAQTDGDAADQVGLALARAWVSLSR